MPQPIPELVPEPAGDRRPLRSLLFTPANRPRFVEKAGTWGADAIILDLEDSIPPAEKVPARAAAVAGVQQWAGQMVYVRVNPVLAHAPYTLAVGLVDIAAVVTPGLCGIVLPKAEAAEDVRAADRALAEAEQRRGLPAGSVEILPLIETARGVWDCLAILQASPRVRRAGFGALDLARDLGMVEAGTGEALLYARSRLALASRVAGCAPPLDTVYPLLDDLVGLEREARLARRLGFCGKMAVHPRQIAVMNAVFSPSAAEISWAQRVKTAFVEAEARGEGSTSVDGTLVDYPVVEMAERTLALARRLGLLEESGAAPETAP